MPWVVAARVGWDGVDGASVTWRGFFGGVGGLWRNAYVHTGGWLRRRGAKVSAGLHFRGGALTKLCLLLLLLPFPTPQNLCRTLLKCYANIV